MTHPFAAGETDGASLATPPPFIPRAQASTIQALPAPASPALSGNPGVEPALAHPSDIHPVAAEPVPPEANLSVHTLAVDASGRPNQLVLLEGGDTLGSILAAQGIDDADTAAALDTLGRSFDLRRLREGQTIEIGSQASPTGGRQLTTLTFDIDARQSLRLRRASGGFAIDKVERPLERKVAVATGEVSGSFYQAAAASGLPAAAVPAIVKLFSWDVDFQRDIQPGDRFAAIYEHMTDADGNPAGLGLVRYAALEVNGRMARAYRFERDDGSSDYLDENGRPLRKWLLRTPIDGARLSSTFGSRRHPVLGYTRMHKGVDFAAPTGTPIFAAGDGKVEFVGRSRGYGNYIRIRHNADYATAYGHMSRFARGLKRGDTVKQGSIIGYVGATGLATGPHLHYEILVDGTQINPLSVKTIEQAQLSGADLRRFRQQKLAIDRQIDQAGHTLVAQNTP
ncbi:peptidoglycan DD-metalloendopeptidase family protein [Arboricoccus pini]|uniref:peptidoglycan DD-metalloendopeptidase family protein n=1 Tax=Arboricoccus pini TaxID=1963835 RepID=UPI0013FDADFC|nr:peptidoglycan DD-metalloendopeptidase family protein [Arboricoccus pini]